MPAGMRVALVHDYLTQRGGAERVVLALHHLFPEAPVYTSVYDPDSTFPEFSSVDVRTTWLHQLTRCVGSSRALLPAYAAAFEGLELRGYDLVLSSSSGWAHGVRSKGAVHVTYCHTPARWLYQTDRYLSAGGPVPAWARPGVLPVLGALRRWDRRAATRPHAYVANSHTVAGRIRKVYGIEAPVVHPPVAFYRPAVSAGDSAEGGYALVIARLLPYKRVDLVIAASRSLGLPLVVVGDGPAAAKLAALADDSVRFLTSIADEHLARLLAGCVALVQAGEEDFGIAPLEANAAGRPVVAFAAGGALETVVHGSTGVLFHEQTVKALAGALTQVAERHWDAGALVRHARQFEEERFHRGLLDVVLPLVGGAPMADQMCPSAVGGGQ